MALQFYIGGSGAGKSKKLHEDIIADSLKNPQINYLVIVPDQYTMQTQMELVEEHPHQGIMNIDVLSFGRLSYRILEEVGQADTLVIDDTGKSLILRKVAENISGNLHAIGSNLGKIGYIHEVKSAISEFMQYGISPEDLNELIAYSEQRGALHHKLIDLKCLYEAFLKEINERFITKEEKLDLLRRSFSKSNIIKNSVVVFDGFTGFTPIQYRVIQELMILAKDVKVTIILDGREDPYKMCGEQKLFYLSKKTIRDLKKLADECSVGELPPVVLTQKENRFTNRPELQHLERHLFRGTQACYEDTPECVQLMEYSSIEAEIRGLCGQIRELLKRERYCYRDLAVVTGDMNGYAPLIERIFKEYELPFYMDYTKAVLLNPFIEYIRSALLVISQDFSYEAVFHFLRCGMNTMEKEQVDLLENYIRKTGIRGRKRWEASFTAKGKRESKDENQSYLDTMNEYRVMVLNMLSPLLKDQITVGDWMKAIHEFLILSDAQKRLQLLAENYEEKQDVSKAKEYGQIYRYVIDLLDQIYSLLGQDEIPLMELIQILDAGFAELQIGTIPREVDRILVGDLERTRLKQIKVLFMLGINDGNIPSGVNKGGIISDIDREFLQQGAFELAPTPRQQMFIQRLYLYMNMTKPTEKLFISYALLNQAGMSLRPSYLIDTMQALFPKLSVQKFTEKEERFLLGKKDVTMGLAEGLRALSAGELSLEEQGYVNTLYQICCDKEEEKTKDLLDAAFYCYQEMPLAKEVARALYGNILAGSITRLEKYAACAYAHFLQYGMALKEREEFDFEPVDMGTVFHNILEAFGEQLKKDKLTWFNFSKEYGEKQIDQLLENYAAQYGDAILFDSARNAGMVRRMNRILKRTIFTLQSQIKQGKFEPRRFEMGFEKITRLEQLDIAPGEEVALKLRGRIDRVDGYEDENNVYIKIIDYKSGNKKFDLAAVYHGLQLQLVVYMNAAMEQERALQEKTPDKKTVIPAAMLYYHMADPSVEESAEPLSIEEINQQIKEKLKMTGMVNDDEAILRMLDTQMEDKSDILPVAKKKDGSFSSASKVLSTEHMELLSEYVNEKMASLGREILSGKIDVKPCTTGKANDNTCTYCSFSSICMFSSKLEGFAARELEDLSENDALVRMMTVVSEKQNVETQSKQ